MTVLFGILIIVGVALQVCVIQSLLVGPRKRYPVLFVYSIILFLITVVDTTAYFKFKALPKSFADYYWTNEVIIKTALFLLVLSFIHMALADDPRKWTVLRGLIACAIAVAAVSAWILYDPKQINRWMTEVSRNLAFFAAIMNLVLWFALLRRRGGVDSSLLMISGGLGIETTGEAIAQSLRQFSNAQTVWIPNLFLIATHLLCLYVWWRALRRQASPVSMAARR